MPVRFEWDNDKAASNLAKHGVTFDEASTVFSDPLAVIFEDEEHSWTNFARLSSATRCFSDYCWSPSPNAVNKALRALIEAMPKTARV